MKKKRKINQTNQSLLTENRQKLTTTKSRSRRTTFSGQKKNNKAVVRQTVISAGRQLLIYCFLQQQSKGSKGFCDAGMKVVGDVVEPPAANLGLVLVQKETTITENLLIRRKKKVEPSYDLELTRPCISSTV